MRAWLAVALVAIVIEAPGVPATRQIVEVRHANGVRASREVLVEGRRHGLQETWWPNGRRRSQAWYEDGAYHGAYRTWRDDGRPYELRHYEHGRRPGLSSPGMTGARSI